jgi:hypothetical protein
MFQSELDTVFHKSIFFMRGVYIQDRLLQFTNVDFRNISGNMFYSADPLHLYMENIDIDALYMNSGLVLKLQCNYPEATINESIILK